MTYLDRICAVPLTAAKMVTADEAVRRYHRETGATRSMETAMVGLMEADGLSDAERPAIMFRMQALHVLLDSGALDPWRMPGIEPGEHLVHEEVLEVAATAPLKLFENDLGFDADEFRRLVLARSEPEGCA